LYAKDRANGSCRGGASHPEFAGEHVDFIDPRLEEARMRRLIPLTVALATAAVVVPAVWAGSPHFVGTPTVTRSGNSLTVSGKEAGLGNETQVEIQVSVQAACLNRGENFPQAANKQTFSQTGTFPVQNGKADFTLTVTATFQPKCSPPMTVVFGDVTVTDLSHGVTTTIPGPF
jgi:hypothetical protein